MFIYRRESPLQVTLSVVTLLVSSVNFYSFLFTMIHAYSEKLPKQFFGGFFFSLIFVTYQTVRLLIDDRPCFTLQIKNHKM